MKGKSTEHYLKVFKEIHNNANQYLPISENYKITGLHSDFENAIGAAAKKIYKDLVVKFCI